MGHEEAVECLMYVFQANPNPNLYEGTCHSSLTFISDSLLLALLRLSSP